LSTLFASPKIAETFWPRELTSGRAMNA